jgi:mannosyltransferase
VQPAALRRVSLRVLLFLLPAAVATGVGLWEFTRVPLSNDEAVTVGVADRSVPQIIETMRHVDAVHGVYYLVMHFVVMIWGTGEVAARVPSLIGTAVAAGLLGLFGQMLRSWRAGLLAGLLFACAPAASQYAQNARPYGIVFALVVGMTMALVAALTTGSNRFRIGMWLLYGVLLLVTVALHALAVLLLPAYAIPVALTARRDRTWRPLAWWVSVSVVALLPLIPLARLIDQQKGTAGWIRPPGWPATLNLSVALAGGSFLLAAGALLVGFAYGQRGDRRLSAFAVAAPWLLIPPALMLVISQFEPLYAFRYVAYCVPALALLGGVSLDRLAGPQHRWWLAVPVTAALIAGTLPANHAVRFQPTGVSSVNDLRAASNYLRDRKEPGDGIIFTAPGQRYLAAAYPAGYAGLEDVTVDETPAQNHTITGTDIDTAATLVRLSSLHRVWTVKYFIWSGGEIAYRQREQEMFGALHEAGFQWQDTHRIGAIAIALWVRPDSGGG